MRIRQPQPKLYQATESSQTPSRFPLSGPTCRACSDTGFISAEGGVLRCDCRKKKETANPPSPNPTPVAACDESPSVPPGTNGKTNDLAPSGRSREIAAKAVGVGEASSIPSAAAKHQLNQCQRLILFLRKRGNEGASNVELATTLKILRYSSRIFSCRKSGYVIEAVEKGDGIWVYFLRYEPKVESPPYIFQQADHSEQDQPKILVGVTANLFSEAGR